MLRIFVAVYSLLTLALVTWGIVVVNEGLILKGLTAAYLMNWIIPAMKMAFGPDCLQKKGS